MRHREYHEAMERLHDRLPGWGGSTLRYLTESSPWVRVPPALALVALGFVGFLPVLGFWMIPLGLLLLAQDVPPLRSPIGRALMWIDRKLPAQKKPAAQRARK